MARSIDTIKKTMDTEQALQPELVALNSPSTTAIYNSWKFITSTVINYIEQLLDYYKKDIETLIKKAPVGSHEWLKSQMFLFQYDAITPQVLAVDSNFAVNYVTEDATKRLITRCSVKTSTTQTVLIKVAKSEPPVALTPTELSSVNGYVNDKAFTGVKYLVSSSNSDKLFLDAIIYYDSQYSAVIQANVLNAINVYLANIDFDGTFKVNSLINYIQGVDGVTDILINNLAIRADVTAFASKTYLVSGKTFISLSQSTLSGYIEGENTVGNTLTDTLTFQII
jgi:hypothetical protein